MCYVLGLQKIFSPHQLLLRKSWKISNPNPPWLCKIANTTVTYRHVVWQFWYVRQHAKFALIGKILLELFCFWMNVIACSGHMRTLECMTYSVDRVVCNGSVGDAEVAMDAECRSRLRQDYAFFVRTRIRSQIFVKKRTQSHFSISAVAGVCVAIS